MENVELRSGRSLFITEKQLAERQASSIRTIQNERLKGSGIPFVKFGSAVRYRLADVEKWEADHTFSNTAEYLNLTESGGTLEP